jgi:hypothetical protein
MFSSPPMHQSMARGSPEDFRRVVLKNCPLVCYQVQPLHQYTVILAVFTVLRHVLATGVRIVRTPQQVIDTVLNEVFFGAFKGHRAELSLCVE